MQKADLFWCPVISCSGPASQKESCLRIEVVTLFISCNVMLLTQQSGFNWLVSHLEFHLWTEQTPILWGSSKWERHDPKQKIHRTKWSGRCWSHKFGFGDSWRLFVSQTFENFGITFLATTRKEIALYVYSTTVDKFNRVKEVGRSPPWSSISTNLLHIRRACEDFYMSLRSHPETD